MEATEPHARKLRAERRTEGSSRGHRQSQQRRQCLGQRLEPGPETEMGRRELSTCSTRPTAVRLKLGMNPFLPLTFCFGYWVLLLHGELA